jgi:hypothetical protein
MDGFYVIDLTMGIMEAILVNGCILNFNVISKKLMSFHASEVSEFQGCCMGVIIQI